MLNGFGDAGRDRAAARGARRRNTASASAISPADMTKPADIRELVAATCARIGRGRYPGQQCRYPARRQSRRLSRGALGRGDRDQSVGRVPCGQGGAAAHDRGKMGPDHQHRLGARARRERREGGLCHRQARARRAHQGHRDRGGERRRDLQRDLPRLGADPAGADSRSRRAPPRRGSRSSRRAHDDLLREKQPMLQFTTPEKIAALAVFLCSDGASTMTGAALSIDGGWVAQ